MVALVLAMATISVTIGSSELSAPGASGLSRLQNPYKRMLPVWISACEKWLRSQSTKRRDLQYYQVACLVYLAKRMNGIRKKRFWKDTGALAQEAVMDRLHLDPPSTDGRHKQEAKRRIWSTIRELDLQNCFDFELPTILHSLESDVAVPANVEDRELAEEPAGSPGDAVSQYRYTRASYQHLAARRWRLRLDISRALYGSCTGKPLGSEDVWRYTEELFRAIDALPPWTVQRADSDAVGWSDVEACMLPIAMLTCQLQDCILALHRRRGQRGSDDFSSLSESLCHNVSKDTLAISEKVLDAGPRTLPLLREDILTACLIITRITLQQPPPRPFSSLVLAGALAMDTSTLSLLEQCLHVLEERYLRCFDGEPWCPLTMLGAIMLLRIHAGTETRQTAKAAIAQRFLDLYYKHLQEHKTSLPDDTDLTRPAEAPLGLESGCDFNLDWDKFLGFEPRDATCV